jgi:hypothetical protein
MCAVTVRTSLSDEPPVSVLQPQLNTFSIASADFDSDKPCAALGSLRSAQRLLAVEQLIERFVADNRYVPGTAQRLLDPSELPPVLERVAMQAQHCSQTWFAWIDGPRTWFVVTEMATVTVRHRKENALRMFFYDDEGRFVSGGTWALQPGGWMLCER